MCLLCAAIAKDKAAPHAAISLYLELLDSGDAEHLRVYQESFEQASDEFKAKAAKDLIKRRMEGA